MQIGRLLLLKGQGNDIDHGPEIRTKNDGKGKRIKKRIKEGLGRRASLDAKQQNDLRVLLVVTPDMMEY